MTNEELLQARDAAWIKWVDWEHEEYFPRWYKKGKGWINAWKGMDELREAQAFRKQLFKEWLALHFQCADLELPAMSTELRDRWKEVSTPNGRRYVRG